MKKETIQDYAILATLEQDKTKKILTETNFVNINKKYKKINMENSKNPISGYQGYLYKKNDADLYIVVHEGSEDLANIFKKYSDFKKDWFKTDGQIINDKIPDQFYDAKKFLETVKSHYGDEKIIQIGQSLGGNLAQTLGALEENKTIETITFNALGAKQIEEYLKVEGFQLSNNNSNIHNIVYKTEIVNRIKKHFGEVITIEELKTLNIHGMDVYQEWETISVKDKITKKIIQNIMSNPYFLLEKRIMQKIKDFPIKDKHLNYKFPESNFNLPPLDLNFKKTDSKQSLIQQKPLFNLENFNFTKEEIRQATNITLPSATTSHPEIVIKSNYNKATNTRVNNIDLNFGKITINSDEDIKNLAYYCCDLAHNLEQCVLSKIKRELQIQQ